MKIRKGYIAFLAILAGILGWAALIWWLVYMYTGLFQ